MKFYYKLAPALIGVSIALVQCKEVAVAPSSTEVNKIAKDITVQIQSKKPRYGSGVIIKKEGNTYTVLTAAHVVEVADKYEIVTPDGKSYPLNYSSVKQLPGVDLAVVQFTGNQNYAVAKIGNSDASTESTPAYVAGFPVPTLERNQSIYNFTEGKITANASKPLREGYALVYDNVTSEGMSGGAVLNDKGELVGIHGKADKDTKEFKTGFNLGVPINTFLKLSAKAGVNVGVRPPSTPVATAPKADNFYIQGGDKVDKGDYKGAIADYTEAIRLNPKYADAYYKRGIARSHSGDKQKAVEDLQKATDLFLKKGNNADAQRSKGLARYYLKDYQGAITAYTEAIRLNPNDTRAYYNRGNARYELGDKQGAIADFNQALRINPNYAKAYYNRGNARSNLGDNQGAIADFNQALRINPNLAEAYIGRGNARYELGDKQGAISDFNQALKINPNFAEAYYNRGVTRYELGDKQGAISDFNQALRINPNFADAYGNRGAARYELGDKQGAIADLQKAADLSLQQGNTQLYQKALELIRQIQQ
ncbi:MAG: tetratricopeptide repeat protein [Iphinoe sp. HA4291-MV1]|jgi:tetratricopeptide (TPR) repeat protein|nr:tetratricopeptide repeat protein [Iphinoe sp. HA4291-MV1]